MNGSLEHARGLLRKAHEDHYAASRLADDSAAPDWTIGFHAQQAAEKAIKAVLSSRSIEYPRTHNLSALIGLLRTNGIAAPPKAEQVASLTPFGAALRYDEMPTEQDSDVDRPAILGSVEDVLAWAESLLKKGDSRPQS